MELRLPKPVYDFLLLEAASFGVTLDDYVGIIIEVSYYCEEKLGLKLLKLEAGIGMAWERGDSGVYKLFNEVSEEEKNRVDQALSKLMERDPTLTELASLHSIPAPTYLAVFRHILLAKAQLAPVADALERYLGGLP